MADESSASVPKNLLERGLRARSRRPCRWSKGSTSVTFGERRMYGGRTTFLNLWRAVLFDPMVIDPRRFDLHRASSTDDLSLIQPLGVAVSHHQGVSVLIALSSGRLEVVGHFCFKNLGEHPTGSLASKFVKVQQALFAALAVLM